MIAKYLKAGLVVLIVSVVVVYVFLRQGPQSFVFAWVLNFMLMMAVLYFTQTFKPQLVSTYYNAKNWEANGAIYKWVGVNLFRKILVWVGWEKLNKAANPVKKGADALKHLEYNTRQSEFGHLIIFFIVLLVNVGVVFYYGFAKSLPLFLLNVILNVYPILVQRYNRPRLQRALRITQAVK
jgi:hypothetical protein